MIPKKIESILTPPPPHMVGDGFRVHNFFPGGRIMDKKRMSPFFLLDYGSKIEFSPSPVQRGVDVHPHAGFETVTIAYHGRIAHHDSAGNSGVISEGDVQWMTAGSGLLHKEYHERTFSEQGGEFQMVQLWVNLPAKFKKTQPKYQAISNDMMARSAMEDGSYIEVIAGEFNGKKGPASTFTPIHVFNAHLKKDGRSSFNFPSTYNTAFLVIKGIVSINGQTAGTDHFVLFGNEGESIEMQATEEAIVLILSGEPIHEPIVAYGPFLMNTWEEIEEAVRDVNLGKYGILE